MQSFRQEIIEQLELLLTRSDNDWELSRLHPPSITATLYQGSIVLIAQLIGGQGLSWTILWSIFWKDLVWAISLSLLHGCVLGVMAIKLLKQAMKR